ncbi:MAG: toll/interleukin-1 receptor domain-containing protein [Candidatus Competibacter sp.]
MSAPPTPRQQVFISYAHADAKWLKRLQVHLKPLERDHRIECWDDTRIQPGMDWRREIDQALARARVAVLLVSGAFLASDFIAKNELPPLLDAAEREGALILPIILGPCRFERTPELSRFQAANPPSKTLEGMKKAEWEQVLKEIGERIEDFLKTP